MMSPRPPIPEWWYRPATDDLLNADGQTDSTDGHFPVLARYVGDLLLKPIGIVENLDVTKGYEYTYDDNSYTRTLLSDGCYDADLARAAGVSEEEVCEDPYEALGLLARKVTDWPLEACLKVGCVWSHDPQDCRDWAIESLGWIRIAGEALECRRRDNADLFRVADAAHAMHAARPDYYRLNSRIVVDWHLPHGVSGADVLTLETLMRMQFDGVEHWAPPSATPASLVTADVEVLHPYYRDRRRPKSKSKS